MSTQYTDEFRRNAVHIATTSGLTLPQVSSDLGVGLSRLNKRVQKHQHDDLLSGPHEGVERQNECLRKEVLLLREERKVLKKRRSSLQAKVGEARLH
jgi:transposase